MFWHNFKYSFLTLLKNKGLIFWTFAFPIILGIFFNMAFANIENNEKLDVIDIAIIDNEGLKENAFYKDVFDTLSKGDDKIFNTKYVSLNEAKDLLNDGSISGYLLLDDAPKITVNSSGINETIFKFVTEEISAQAIIMQKYGAIKINEKMEENPLETGNYNSWYAEIYAEIMNLRQKEGGIKDTSSSQMSYTMIEYYTLISMACLYGGMLAMSSLNNALANMSTSGKRIAVSPASKSKIVLSTVLASYLMQIIGLILLFIFLIFIVHTDFGPNLYLVILLSLVGSLAGLSLGIMVSSLFKTNENLKVGIILSITMFGCFLSGMMGITMKYIIDKNIPLLNKINPASMITDGFYALYYYDSFDRYILNVVSLLIFSVLMIMICIASLRRQKYDSI